LAVLALAAWPIMVTDTDTWYHLNGGRYLVEHGTIPRESFFSFISPPRPWTAYYWLFQALLYGLYTWWGYYGLIALRTTILLAALFTIWKFLFHGRAPRGAVSWLAFVFVCYSLVLAVRYLNVRPQMFTYLFIVLFVFILECHPRRAWLLPLLAVLWCNLHGIAYPLMLLVLAAYALEESWRRWGSKRPRKPERDTILAWAALSACAVFLTPHGLELLKLPFLSTADASHYIEELKPVVFWGLFSFHVSALTPDNVTLFNLLLVGICLTAIAAVARGTLRLSHALLCLGGLVLLLKGVRFIHEFSLLALPLLKATPLIPRGVLRWVPKPVYFVSAGVLMAMPLAFLFSAFKLDHRPAYPFSYTGLPEGVASFLNQIEAGGEVLNHPNSGGYLQWRLSPSYRIFMDMEVPLLFTDDDMYTAGNMFVKREVLTKVLQRYRPAFLSVPHRVGAFRKLIEEFPTYRLVFFDDAEMVYVNQTREPAIAQHYELQALDPYDLTKDGPEKLVKGNEDEWGDDAEEHDVDQERRPDNEALLREALSLLEIFPGCGILNHLAATIYERQDAYDKMLPHAEAMIRYFPESPIGFRVKGDAMKELKQFEQALEAYEQAMQKSPGGVSPAISKQIGSVYFEQGRYGRAYTLLREHAHAFSFDPSRDDLYQLAVSARMTGRPKEGEATLRYLEQRISSESSEDAEWRRKIAQERAALNVAPEHPEGR